MKQTEFACIALTPFERPDPGLALAFARAGAASVLDMGRQPAATRAAFDRVRTGGVPIGIRVPDGVALDLALLPPNVTRVVVTAGVDVARFRPREVWVECRSLAEARAAAAAGADAVIAKGHESGGAGSEQTAFVLAQHLLGQCSLPIYVQGGIGLHTAAACAAVGAAGVILDSQLALLRESTLPSEVKAAIAALDGSETAVIGGYRVLVRPDLPSAALGADADPCSVRALLGADDLRRNVIPAGQDAAFARGLAQRFEGARELHAGFGAAVREHLAQAERIRPLAPGSALAQAWGTARPIAQGPMTRVSDRPAFADAVSRAGGMPFLALSLMSGAQVQQLVQDTAALLGERPFGVGLLGFVPAELRAVQIEALQTLRPKVALIAGGRPAQARVLEAAGTTTFLHVPSPGLLELFVHEGARKFVFEGRECGGHVGPRSSFTLWEQQIDCLAAVPDPQSLYVLFAGGIHDARSAAMVAAMAAPLAARGAKIGVLMGTAYLFTHEAVDSGAIQPAFQRAAAACAGTVLLETSPGHATRCASSEYVRTFSAEKARLQAARVTREQLWLELEQLNLGRLRIAAKGLRRDGERLQAIDAASQVREGMYMLGQVAELRQATCSVEALHHDVCEGGTARLAALPRSQSRAERSESRQRPVAIIGMACIFPGAPDLETFWANILAGHDAVTEVPRERWNADLYYDPAATGAGAGRKTPSKWGAFVPKTRIDPLSYGIAPNSLAAIDPVQLLSLEVARRALSDAGYKQRAFDRARTSVIFGAEAGTDLAGAYGLRAMLPQVTGCLPEALDAALPSLSEDSFPGVLTNVIAGRIANRLDLGGLNFTVDAACASSLAAVDLAVKELAAGGSDMVLCGGADLHNSIQDYLMFASVHALSPTGRCRPFDAAADGIVLGEGVACVVLKRLEDAQRDGDRVYAVIEGIAGSSDGRSLGLTAPNREGQERALQRAYARAGVSPAQIGLLEAHGTGTVVGDRTELRTLTEFFSAAGAQPGGCALGSVKSQIGHTKCAAGMAGLIKASLSVQRAVRPPTLHVQTPTAEYESGRSPFSLSGTVRPWPASERRAALSALGFGGTNFHAVLRAPSAAPASAPAEVWPAELLLIRGASRAEALACIDRIEAWLDSDVELALREIAMAVSRGALPVQLALVVENLQQLRGVLAQARRFEDDDRHVFVPVTAPVGKVAFLFAGQGNQRPGMFADVLCAFPALQAGLRAAPHLVDRIFPGSPLSTDEARAQREALTDTRVAQPALGLVELALYRLLRALGAEPDMLGGHSYGELAALCAAGSFDESALLGLSEARAEAILAAAGDDPGAMAAVASGAQAVLDAIGDREVVVANHNGPRQVVIAGPTRALERALLRLSAAGLSAQRISVACAFHSPLVAGAAERFAAVLHSAGLRAPALPVFSNTDAQCYPEEPSAIALRLSRQLAEPVRFDAQVGAMYEAGARVFVEVGPGRTLCGLVANILREAPHIAIACDRPGEAGVPSLLRALARMAAHGVALDADALFGGRALRTLCLDDEPDAQKSSAWWVDGHTATPIHGPLPVGALRPFLEPVAIAPAASVVLQRGALIASDARDAPVLEYLQGMRELVAAQRDVMLGYLQSAQRSHASPRAVLPVATTPMLARAALGAQDAAAPMLARAALDAQESAALPHDTSARDLDPRELLLAIVAARTGYPIDMLGLDIDLEADLSIDSIKRIEILGELRNRLQLPLDADADQDQLIEALAQMKSLRAILDWLAQRGLGSAATVDSQGENAAVEQGLSVESLATPRTAVRTQEAQLPDAHDAPVRRYVVSVRPAPAVTLNGTQLQGRRFGITDDGRGVAHVLTGLLQRRGAEVRPLSGGDDASGLDGVLHLAPLAQGAGYDAVKDGFSLMRGALLGGARHVLMTSALGGDFGLSSPTGVLPIGGLSGAIKTLAREWPEARTRIVDLDPEAAPEAIADWLQNELLAADRRVEIGYREGTRYERTPDATAALDAGTLALDADSVVLITGGARGISARIALALARRYRCRLELIGRSPLPLQAEPPELAGALDATSLRRALIAAGQREPAKIEAECARVLAQREVMRSLCELRATGAPVRYHALDVRDAAAFEGLIDRLYADYGRIDGVIHGAGVLEDRLIRDKSDASFARVFDTKVEGALTLARKLRDQTGFVVFLSSVAGLFGNRGQVDYAAANDALDALARGLDRRIAGRALAVGFGPWAGAGMVHEALATEYARRGISLIPPDVGVECLLDEIAHGRDPHVLLMCAAPEQLRG